MRAISMASASCTILWPSPASDAMVSLPRIDKQRDREADPQAGQDDRQRRRQQHVAEQLIVGRAHRARRRDEDSIDIAEAGNRIEHDRKEADGGAERDLGGGAEAEEQHVERQEQDDRDGVDAGSSGSNTRIRYCERLMR